MIAKVSCIYSCDCKEKGMACATCEYFDDGDYEALSLREYYESLVEARLDYLEMIEEYTDGNDEVIV